MIYDENGEPSIVDLLPKTAALALSRAARVARDLPEDSIDRKLEINRTIKKVKSEYPEFFKSEDRTGCHWRVR